MDAPITTNYDLTGAAIYGTRLRDYAIDGEGGKSFSEVIAFASLRQSHSIEQVTTAVSSVVRLRQEKVSDLSEVLSVLAEALAAMPKDGVSEKRWSTISSSKVASANALLKKYGLKEMETGSDGRINYAVATKSQNDIQLLLDTEDNDLQQNMTALQSLLSKRDNAFSTANKVIQKGNSTARSTINALGA